MGRVEGAAEGGAERSSTPPAHCWTTGVEEEERRDGKADKRTVFNLCICSVCVDTHPCSAVLESCLPLDAGGSGMMPPSSGNPGNRNLEATELIFSKVIKRDPAENIKSHLKGEQK